VIRLGLSIMRIGRKKRMFLGLGVLFCIITCSIPKKWATGGILFADCDKCSLGEIENGRIPLTTHPHQQPHSPHPQP
jgi:hypothetical protein